MQSSIASNCLDHPTPWWKGLTRSQSVRGLRLGGAKAQPFRRRRCWGMPSASSRSTPSSANFSSSALSLNGQAGQFGLVDHRSPPSGWVVATSVANPGPPAGSRRPGFGFLVLCRRRDSNPRHADYDCARAIAGECVLLRVFAARRPFSGVERRSRLRAVSVASAEPCRHHRFGHSAESIRYPYRTFT